AFRNCVVTGAPPTAAPATAPGRTLGLVTVGVCAALVRRRVLAACGPFAAGGVGAAVVGLLVGAAVVLLVGFLVVVLGAAGSVLGALLIGLGTLLRLGLAGLGRAGRLIGRLVGRFALPTAAATASAPPPTPGALLLAAAAFAVLGHVFLGRRLLVGLSARRDGLSLLRLHEHRRRRREDGRRSGWLPAERRAGRWLGLRR